MTSFSWRLTPSTAVPLLLLLSLLVGSAAAQSARNTTSTPTQTAVRSIYREIDIAAARLAVSSPPWLGRQQHDTSDNPLVNRKQHVPGARPQQTSTGSDAAAATNTAGSSAATNAAGSSAAKVPTRFIVQLKADSAAAAVRPTTQATAAAAEGAGDASAGAAATRSTPTSRITPQAAATAAAVQSQAQAAATAAGLTTRQISHRYSYALAGFAVERPTAAQLAALAADPNVLSVTEDYMVHATTYTTPQFLGLANTFVQDPRRPGRRIKKRGVWDQLGGVVGRFGAGEDVLVGVIDTGIWMPNHTCFADTAYWSSGSNGLQQSYKPLLDFKGQCSATEGQSECNNKVVGCRFYTAGWGGDSVISSVYPYEYLSCRDVDGHGSHTSSTAAGNYGGVSPNAPAGSTMSGMAPRSRLAMYKALWGRDGAGMASDILAAVEDAIKDGVDVINYSASTSPDSFRNAVVAAFMNAARAGIFVAAAAGNDGPDAAVNSISPWVTTVAASTHDRSLEVLVAVGNGEKFVGVGTQPAAVGPLPLVYAADIPATDNITRAALCAPDSVNASKLEGPVILVCDRGEFVIKDKMTEVERVGGKAMVLLNVPDGKTDQLQIELSTPFVHLKANQRAAVMRYIQSAKATATATLGAATAKLGNTAPAMADFSSRGPVPIANSVVMKPDITAPGVSIYAAYTGSLQTLYTTLQGTSMATPHIAGIAALLKYKYPSWSPMAIKSALMTTAYQTTRTGTVGQSFGTPLDYGAGHVDPIAALQPGLVFDSNYTDWQRLLCDVEPFPGDKCESLCPEFAASSTANTTAQPGLLCNSYNFNGPWVAGDVSGSLSVTRTLSSVLAKRDGRVQFTAKGSADANSSFNVEVTPSKFKLRAQQSQQVTITVSARTDTPLNQQQFGEVVWRSARGHVVRIPIVVKFSEFVAPEYIRPILRMPSFQTRYKVGADAATTVRVANLGMTAAQVTEVEVQRTTSTNLDSPGVGKVEVTVAEGNTYFMAGIFSQDVSALVDLDLHLYQGATLISKSVSDSSTELIEATKGLPPGQYQLYVYPYSLPTETATAYVHVWQVPSEQAQQAGLMQVSPSSVAVQPGGLGSSPITLSFDGLDFSGAPVQRYIGVLANSRGDGKPATVPRTRVYIF